MTRQILHPLLALLACATRQELARQVAYLKEENRILRARLPQRIVTTPAERRRLPKVGLVALVAIRFVDSRSGCILCSEGFHVDGC